MVVSSWRGGWCVGALGIAALIVFALMFGPGTGDAATSAPAAAKKCTKAIVGGKQACLRKGDKCKKRFQEDYIAVGLQCKKSRLRKASIKQLRGGQPLLLSDRGYLSLKTALAAFDSEVADLPGVKPKPGEVGKVTEATYVIERIEAELDKLTAKQRAVFTQATTPAPDALMIDPDNPRRSLERARRAPATPQELIIDDAFMDNAVAVLRKHGYFPPRKISLTVLDNQGTGKSDDLGYVSSGDLSPGTSPTCNVFLTKEGRKFGATDVQFILAHEAVHCMQHAFYANQAQQKAVPAWIKEGTADYLGAKVMQELNVGTPTQVAWTKWLTKPQTDLFTRTYDALGFFAMLEQANVDTWSRIKTVIAGAVSGGSEGAYAAALAGVPDIFYMRWGPGILRDPALGPEWDYTGPYIDPSRPKTVTIAPGAPKTSRIEAHAGVAAILKLNADVVQIKADKDIRGLLRFVGTQVPLKKGAYCVKSGGCKCRSNTPLQLPKLGSTTYLGYGDAKKPRVVTIQGRTLKDYCDHPTPPPSGSGDGGGGSCPTTPTARPAMRRECPAPSPGIGVYMGEEATQVANFTIGACTQGAGGFTAIAEDGPWHLEVGISNFNGFGDYDVPYGGPDPLVVVEGPPGTFSNATWAPPGLPNAGAIHFGDEHHMGVGWIEFRTADESAAIAGAGGMTCVYPDDE